MIIKGKQAGSDGAITVAALDLINPYQSDIMTLRLVSGTSRCFRSYADKKIRRSGRRRPFLWFVVASARFYDDKFGLKLSGDSEAEASRQTLSSCVHDAPRREKACSIALLRG